MLPTKEPEESKLAIDGEQESLKSVWSAASRQGGMKGMEDNRQLAPIVHVFSHQRHTMHITIKEVSVTCAGRGIEAVGEEILPIIEPQVTEGKRESRWMSAEEIREKGITSGCKKILEAVERHYECGSETNKAGIQKKAGKRAAERMLCQPEKKESSIKEDSNEHVSKQSKSLFFTKK